MLCYAVTNTLILTVFPKTDSSATVNCHVLFLWNQDSHWGREREIPIPTVGSTAAQAIRHTRVPLGGGIFSSSGPLMLKVYVKFALVLSVFLLAFRLLQTASSEGSLLGLCTADNWQNLSFFGEECKVKQTCHVRSADIFVFCCWHLMASV